MNNRNVSIDIPFGNRNKELVSLSNDIFNTVQSHGSFAFELVNYIAVVDDESKPFVSENLNEIVQITIG